jgi:hypothetical protein
MANSPSEEGHPDHEAFLEWTYEVCMGWTALNYDAWIARYKEDASAE